MGHGPYAVRSLLRLSVTYLDVSLTGKVCGTRKTPSAQPRKPCGQAKPVSVLLSGEHSPTAFSVAQRRNCLSPQRDKRNRWANRTSAWVAGGKLCDAPAISRRPGLRRLSPVHPSPAQRIPDLRESCWKRGYAERHGGRSLQILAIFCRERPPCRSAPWSRQQVSRRATVTKPGWLYKKTSRTSLR